MGKYIYTALTFIGIILVFAYYIAMGVRFAFYYGDDDASALNLIPVCIYACACLSNFGICCLCWIQNIYRYFNIYNIIAFIAVLCAFFDGTLWRLENGAVKTYFILVFIVSLACLIVTFQARNLVMRDRAEMLDQFSEGQGPTVITGGDNLLPKFDMALHVERAEVRELPEARKYES